MSLLSKQFFKDNLKYGRAVKRRDLRNNLHPFSAEHLKKDLACLMRYVKRTESNEL